MSDFKYYVIKMSYSTATTCSTTDTVNCFFKFRFTCGQQLTNPFAPYAWDRFIMSISLAPEYLAPVLVVHKLDSFRGCPAIEAQLQIEPSFLNHAKQNTKSFKMFYIFVIFMFYMQLLLTLPIFSHMNLLYIWYEVFLQHQYLFQLFTFLLNQPHTCTKTYLL
jgi:hypothetical protein